MGRVALSLLLLALSGLCSSAFAVVVIPAGTVLSMTGSSCPAGFTAYAAGVGRVQIGKGTLGSDTYALGDTGGSARHTLTVSEVPSLSGTTAGGSISGSTDSGGAHTHAQQSGTMLSNTTAPNTGGTFEGAGTGSKGGTTQSGGSHLHTFTGSFSGLSFTTTGGGGAHENRQPYVAMTQCTLDADFTGGDVTAELFVWALVVMAFAGGVIAGQQR